MLTSVLALLGTRYVILSRKSNAYHYNKWQAFFLTLKFWDLGVLAEESEYKQIYESCYSTSSVYKGEQPILEFTPVLNE